MSIVSSYRQSWEPKEKEKRDPDPLIEKGPYQWKRHDQLKGGACELGSNGKFSTPFASRGGMHVDASVDMEEGKGKSRAAWFTRTTKSQPVEGTTH